MAIVTKVTKTDAVAFDDIKSWFNEHMHVDAIDLEDQKPYEVYENARWAGIFQLTSKGAQKFFEKAKPKSITDIAALTSIYRPGPLAANVDKLYLEAKAGNFYDWGDQRINELLSKTHGCLSGDSVVMTDNGNITIKEIVEKQMIGLSLPSFNEETNSIEQDSVVAAIMTGVREVIELDTEIGKLSLTDDHPVMTLRGWVPAGELTLQDEILSIGDYTYLSGAMLKDEKTNSEV